MPLSKLLDKPADKFSKLQKKQLLDDHRIRHGWWASLNKGKKLKDKETGEPITKKQVIKEHTKIVKKMFQLGFDHNIVDSLDETLSKELKEKSKTQSSIRKIIQKNIFKKAGEKINGNNNN